MAALGEREPAELSARRVEAMVARHGAAVLRVANQFSLCHDDALDAYQRAFEIYLRRMEALDPATEGAWLRVVVKHEAMAIRRARLDSVDRDDLDLDDNIHGGLREVDEAVAGCERVERSVEALHALKPDEARALLLKAEGLSYQEIGRRFGWSYTKVNRSITEGRARFLKTYSGIEAGEECERHAETLTALAAGEATGPQLVAIRPHLRHCATCRASVREMRFSRSRRIALLLPFGWLVRLLSRQDVTTTMYAASNGGGRLGPAAAILGLCLSGVGAGAACVMTGALPAPPIIAHITEEPKRAEKPKTKTIAVAKNRGKGARGADLGPAPVHAAHPDADGHAEAAQVGGQGHAQAEGVDQAAGEGRRGAQAGVRFRGRGQRLGLRVVRFLDGFGTRRARRQRRRGRRRWRRRVDRFGAEGPDGQGVRLRRRLIRLAWTCVPGCSDSCSSCSPAASPRRW